jgi:hypothetical protein
MAMPFPFEVELDGLKPETLRELVKTSGVMIDMLTGANNGLAHTVQNVLEHMNDRAAANGIADLLNAWSTAINAAMDGYNDTVRAIVGKSPASSGSTQ